MSLFDSAGAEHYSGSANFKCTGTQSGSSVGDFTDTSTDTSSWTDPTDRGAAEIVTGNLQSEARWYMEYCFWRANAIWRAFE